VGTATTWQWVQDVTPLDDIDLEDDDEDLDQTQAGWEAV
jgi:hypothetical protein